MIMQYRANLTPDGVIDDNVFRLLTDAQQAKLCRWSLQSGRHVAEMLVSAAFVAEQYADTDTVSLIGTLPNCGLHGAMLPDGSTHT
jgi:hypothetical protein